MVNVLDRPSTVNLLQTRLQLRSELRFMPQRYGTEWYYHIEVPATGKYYRVGYAEYVFVSLLDGQRTFAEALAWTARLLGASSLSQDRAETVYLWLLEQNLAECTRGDMPGVSSSSAGAREARSGAAQHLLWWRLSAGCPDGVLTQLLPFFGWLLSPLAVTAGCLVILLGTCIAASRAERLFDVARDVLVPANWLWLLLVWVILKLLHEGAHGLASKRLGGRVADCGIVLACGAPLAYVDVTSSWSFPRARDRIAVALAGMYAELVIAALAVMVWTQVDHAELSWILRHVVVLAGVSTVVFNLNPLMRFDGYYVLSDLLQIPNLHDEATGQARRWGQAWLWGATPSAPQAVGATTIRLGLFGLAILAWRCVVMVSLALLAGTLIPEGGYAVAGIVLVLLGWPVVRRVVQNWWTVWEERPVVAGRALAIVVGAAGILLGAIAFLPAPGTLSVPGVVAYRHDTVLRSQVGAFVEQVLVDDGEDVTAGQVLLKLTNDELELELRELQHGVAQAEIRYRSFLESHDTSQAELQRQSLHSLRRQLQEKQAEREGLVITAPRAGRVVQRNLQQLAGKYCPEGTVLLTLAQEEDKEFLLSLGDDQIDQAMPALGANVEVRVAALPRQLGTLQRIEPQASTDLLHPQLAAPWGGPLAVQESSGGGSGERSTWILTQPRFQASVELPAEVAVELAAGQRGHAVVGWKQERLHVYLRRQWQQWWDRARANRGA